MEEPLSLAELERLAHETLEPAARAYIAGGAGEERTVRGNREAFERRRLRPRVLVDVSSASGATTVLGTPVAMPVLVAPTAFHLAAHPERELATARAAASAETIFCLSTLATASPAEVARAAPNGPRWLQLYVFRDRGVTDAILEEALNAGFGAVVLTVDVPVVGVRDRELDAVWAPPEDSVPSFVAARARGSVFENPLTNIDPSLDWSYLAELCGRLPVPVVVKGVLTAEDARLACEHGAAGIVVSNHGGRQLDGAVATLDALPEVVEAVAGRAEVYVDGGVRRGTDVVTALALGARAVLVGRPVLYGLSLGGEAGVRRVLELFRAETENALALLGCRSPDEVTRAHVALESSAS
jgi:isopentenyl diphosphate isomerase/L-lactate dehydrogenase-like FMN-dependent dehydrogenase